ncbi:UDP-glucosyltransferase 2-like [Malaya genurostris]|uniref:UDP-glucosyltransferase 2-like n=1 Tax=Malaya genurostris TaxID=325434 RepID=UPI0026F3F231|nr:UDP-glucosyltransferase 2-like [Malaya genurostris]
MDRKVLVVQQKHSVRLEVDGVHIKPNFEIRSGSVIEVIGMKCIRTWIALVIVVLSGGSRAARILAIFPVPAKSHQIVFGALIEGLLERGHHLTVMSPDPFKTNNPNITQIDWNYAYKVIESASDVAKTTQERWSSLKVVEQMLLVTKLFTEAELNHPTVKAMIQNRSEQFDAVIVECFQITPFHAFAELYNVPLIGITSIDAIAIAHGTVGNVANAIANPEANNKFGTDMTFWQRIETFIGMLVLNFYLFPREFAKYDKIIEQYFGSNMTKSEQLMSRIDFLMVNAEPALGFVRPIAPASVQLGFLHVKPPKALPSEFQQYLDRSSRGVIYFSLGTLIRTTTLNQRNVQLFLDVFRSLPYEVLWKCDGQIDLNGVRNVRLVSWLPQQDVLGVITVSTGTNIDINLTEQSGAVNPIIQNISYHQRTRQLSSYL